MTSRRLSSDSASQSQWTQHPERGSKTMLRIMTWISLHLGRRIGRVVLHLITLYFMLFSPSAHRASRHYLRRALGRRPGFIDHYRHVFAFASAIHDRIYLLNERFDLFDITIHGKALIDKTLASQHGAFLFGAHMGSFEVVRAIGRQQPALHIAMVMYEENARKINSMLSAINPAAQHNIIAIGTVDSMLQVRDQLNDGALIGILADRSPGEEATRTMPFLGDEATFPVGPFRMAAMLGRPVLFMAGLYHGGNRYSIHFDEIADFSSIEAKQRDAAIDQAMQRYVGVLEKHCRSAPYNWFNFFEFWPNASAQGKVS